MRDGQSRARQYAGAIEPDHAAAFLRTEGTWVGHATPLPDTIDIYLNVSVSRSLPNALRIENLYVAPALWTRGGEHPTNTRT